MSKGGTAQELFIVCPEDHLDEVKAFVQEQATQYLASYR
jgi:hypothetical protein